MGKNPRIGDPIDRLLQERQQYATWLSRLDATADTAPESVRGKVRSDYKSRLDSVVDQLRSHSDGLAQQLERHRDTRSELLTREEQAKEIMSEAEVRHAVGEYSDTKWQQIRGEAQKNLVAIREELAQLGEEIAELENVQTLIAAPAAAEPESVPPPPVPPPAPPDAVTPAPPPVMAAPVEPAPEPVAPSSPPPEPVAAEPPPPPPPPPPEAASQTSPGHPAPPRPPATPLRPVKPKEGAAPGRTLWFPSVKEEEAEAAVDELAFLKSVSEDETAGPSARRASGQHLRPPDHTVAPQMSPVPSPPPASGGGPSAEGRSSTSTGARTLKCGECGTMNRPTEWYCERCGAELADL
jgi:hypothetical protein